MRAHLTTLRVRENFIQARSGLVVAACYDSGDLCTALCSFFVSLFAFSYK